MKKIITHYHFSKWDIIFLIFLVFIGIGITAWIYLPADNSSDTETLLLEVRQNGKTIKKLPLSTDTEENITNNEQTNTFLIKEGTVSMTEANCGDHTCIQTGEIQQIGESIVCLPHRLVLQIISSGGENTTDDSDGNKPDIIAR